MRSISSGKVSPKFFGTKANGRSPQNMNGIKLILLLGLFLCFYSYLRFFRSLLLDRVIAIALVGCAAVVILIPDLTTTIARFLGVGRGTDLIFYLFALGTVYAIILLYSKVSRMWIVQTELARYIAIHTAESAGKSG